MLSERLVTFSLPQSTEGSRTGVNLYLQFAIINTEVTKLPMCFYLPKFISPPVFQLCVVLLVLPKKNGSFFLQERRMLLRAWGANPWPPHPLDSASLLSQHSQLFNANTSPDNRSENKPSEGSKQERFWEDLTFFCSICILTVANLWDVKGVSSLLS